MVATGTGVALLPASLARVVGNAAAVVPLKKSPLLSHVFARVAGKPSPSLHQFVETLARL